MNKFRSLDDLKRLRERLVSEMLQSGRPRIVMCCGTGCAASGSWKVVATLEEYIKKRELDIEVVKTGCQGLCQKGPLMKVEPHGYFYQKVRPSHAQKIVEYTTRAEGPIWGLLYRDGPVSRPIETMEEVPFYKKQHRRVLKNNARINPTDINHYISHDGYLALEQALFSLTPDDVIEEVKKSGLRGRGGAGFPTGIKWETAKRTLNKTKIVVANGDEGDPGAFMDRSIMEGDPHAIIEGMLICAYAVGARYGFIYVRHEYPLAVENLGIAVGQAQNMGLLGDNILGTDFSFDISIKEGAGAFVCGEETALLVSIEGQRGFPLQRPPYPAEEGVWSYPTCINNIETFANVSHIIIHGGNSFAEIGTERSKGTKVFALAGKIKNTGLIEVPMGITLKEIIYDISGGILQDRRLKAVQTGGPSGGCIPAELIDLQIDFDSLLGIGSMMGSGGLVVMSEDDCMVGIARYFLSFCRSESCGKCPSCRIGTYQMLQILNKIIKGEGVPGDIERLQYIGNMVKESSLCGLGKTAPNPVLSTIKYFREEYEEHINNKFCRAKACRGLGLYKIDNTECLLCSECKQVCAYNAIVELRDSFYIDQDYCVKCKACYEACPFDTVKIEGCYPHV
ncbi:NADH-quinone oxidoreductase subunit NuoF [Thermodesulfovibrionales bacterium]|nr:NADH-quinone oxidoreductase subunit NuoF [Thermodesulfovibrionales bacterium]